MKSRKDPSQEEVLLVALSQLGKAVDIMQDLIPELEAQLHAQRGEGQDKGRSMLNSDVPKDRTIH
jgi:hypothetical protein